MSTEEHNIDPAQLEELLPMALFALFKLYCPEQEDIPQFICSLVWSMFSDQEMHYLITLSLNRGYMKIVLDRESWRLKILPPAAGVEFVKTILLRPFGSHPEIRWKNCLPQWRKQRNRRTLKRNRTKTKEHLRNSLLQGWLLLPTKTSALHRLTTSSPSLDALEHA